MKKHYDPDIYFLLAGALNSFIKDMEEEQKSSKDKAFYEGLLPEAKQMKGKLNIMSNIDKLTKK